mgnify:CR=1 FL=1
MTPWTYDYSEKLKMKYAYQKTSTGMHVMTEDKVRYAPDEIAVLNRAGGITPEVHRLKKVFDGRVVDPAYVPVSDGFDIPDDWSLWDSRTVRAKETEKAG